MILIRADANEHIGTGHVMRCMSIARALAEKGEKAIFVTADHRGDGLIMQGGFSAFCLNSEWTEMEKELPALQNLIKNYSPSLLLIDSYYVTEQYFKDLSSAVHTAYIDDMNRLCWDIDYLINYNIFAAVYNYAWYEGKRTKLLLHPQYAPLRDEFRVLPKHKINEAITDVLVSAGGADPEGITERLMIEVCPEWKNVNFHFIVGALNPRIDEITKLSRENAILHINERNMSELMKKCDIAISAAGTTLYELCAAGIPTITYTLADNQLVAAEQFEAQGIMINAGDCRENKGFIGHIESSLRDLTENVDKRRNFSEKMQTFVDGNGAERIVEELL